MKFHIHLLGRFFLLLLCCSCQPRESQLTQARLQPPERYVGFSVFGPDWIPEKDFATRREFLAEVEKQGFLVAQHASQLYGNLVRVPLTIWGILYHPVAWHPLVVGKPVYLIDEETLCERLNSLQGFLDESIFAFENGQYRDGQPLKWDMVDAFFAGIQRYNSSLNAATDKRYRPIVVDVLVVDLPPALILEAPPLRIMQYWGAQTSEQRLWETYQRLHIRFIEQIIARYGLGYSFHGIPAHVPIARAIEMLNEPDYLWLPDEAQFEKAIAPDAYPCDKYLSQLHLTQIPENDLPSKGCERQFGYYREQELGVSAPPTAVRDFRWGKKFDKYVAAFAELHAHASTAALEAITQGGAHMLVVSSAVTHVNIDWFMRMFRANPQTFHAVDAIAIHPYHWPEHDIYNLDFVSPVLQGNGLGVSPREYASHYCKRFDYLQRLADLVKQSGRIASYGMGKKPIWITEFGLQTKKLGKFNDALRNHARMFVYERAAPIPEGVKAMAWEDRWEAFLSQVSADYLRKNRVESFLIYTLRESTQGQTNDDDHSNYALYRADWSCRLAPQTLQRIAELFLQFRDG